MFKEVTYPDLIEVVHPSKIVQVRITNEIWKDDEVVAQSFSRYTLEPGADLTGQPESVVKICTAIWS